MRRIRVFLCVALIGSIGFAGSASQAQAAGFCGNSSPAEDKVFVDKDHSELNDGYFDLVRGDTSVGQANPCVGTAAFPYAQGSWLLLANMEDSEGAGGNIMQGGYGRGCTLGCVDDFVYTPAANGSGAAWPGLLTPVRGHRVRLEIKRIDVSGTNYAKYTFTNLTTGQWEATTATWDGGNNKVWWGAEVQDTSSEVGVDENLEDANLAYMGYSTTQSGTTYYRSGMVFNSCYCENSPGGGPSEVEKFGQTNSWEHGHLGTWVYGNDMVNFESHQ